MAPDISGGLRNCTTATKSKHALKKGPWTTSEDMILVEYVKKHGEGNWNAVQRNSGLMRCGKSCRLRWANHLRPNLKKGAFTPDEEKLIVELHAKLGNKWARMAAQLPGRTDNEIKNYWNTRLKRRQRAGLPIYPQQEHHHHHLQLSSPSSISPSLITSHLASSNPNPLIYYDAFTSPSLISPSHNQLKLYARGASNSSNHPFFNQQGISNPLPMPSLPQYNALDYGSDTGVLGLPSIQSSAVVTPVASSSDFVVSDGGVEDYEVERGGFGGRSKSGLLEDLLGESYNNPDHHDKTEDHFINGGSDENMHDDQSREEGFGFDNNYEGINSKGGREENNSMDEDLLNLLDNFPLTVPIPDWDEVRGDESPMLSDDGTNGGMESQPRYNQVATSNGAPNQDSNFGSCLWNNMPTIY